MGPAVSQVFQGALSLSRMRISLPPSGVDDLGCANPELRIRSPAGDIARILRVEHDGARRQVDPVDVHELAVAQVHRDQHLVGKGRVRAFDDRAHALERRVVADVAARKVDAERVEILVAVVVLQVHERLVVFRPQVTADSAFLVRGHDLVVILADGLHPDLQHVLRVGGDPGEPLAVGRELGADALGVAEQHIARNQRRRLRGELGRRRKARDDREQAGVSEAMGHR